MRFRTIVRAFGDAPADGAMHRGTLVVYERMLRHFRECVRNRNYVITSHADEEMSADGYTVFDVERGVLSGRILEKQIDEKTGESKYRIRGSTALGRGIELVAKLGLTSKMVVVTVYAP